MSPKRVNKYPIAFRQMALERMKNCASVSALAEELGVHRTVLYHWQRQLEAGHDGTPTSAIRQLRKEVRDLKRVLAEMTLEADFFQGALQKVEARRRSNTDSASVKSRSAVTDNSRKTLGLYPSRDFPSRLHRVCLVPNRPRTLCRSVANRPQIG